MICVPRRINARIITVGGSRFVFSLSFLWKYSHLHVITSQARAKFVNARYARIWRDLNRYFQSHRRCHNFLFGAISVVKSQWQCHQFYFNAVVMNIDSGYQIFGSAKHDIEERRTFCLLRMYCVWLRCLVARYNYEDSKTTSGFANQLHIHNDIANGHFGRDAIVWGLQFYSLSPQSAIHPF